MAAAATAEGDQRVARKGDRQLVSALLKQFENIQKHGAEARALDDQLWAILDANRVSKVGYLPSAPYQVLKQSPLPLPHSHTLIDFFCIDLYACPEKIFISAFPCLRAQ